MFSLALEERGRIHQRATMTHLTNPHESDPSKAAAFELGYRAGFYDPAGDTVDFRPLTADLLDAFVEGADAGRQDAHAPPGGNEAFAWLAKPELGQVGEDPTDEMAEHLSTFTLFKVLEEITEITAFGLVDLVILAVGIQGNFSPEQLKPVEPLEDDFSEDLSAPHSDAVSYVAACSRTDHVQGASGVASEGFWSGAAHHDFKDALREVMRHEHREALVARCNVELRTCGAVWVAKPTE